MEPENVLLVRSLLGDVAGRMIARQGKQCHRIHITLMITTRCEYRQAAMLSVLLCIHTLRGSVTQPRSKIRRPFI